MILLIAWGGVAFLTALVADEKGRGFGNGFIWGACFPVFALVYFLAMPSREAHHSINKSTIRSHVCRHCWIEVPYSVKYCPQCKRFIA